MPLGLSEGWKRAEESDLTITAKRATGPDSHYNVGRSVTGSISVHGYRGKRRLWRLWRSKVEGE
jgi:hypothetical protein